MLKAADDAHGYSTKLARQLSRCDEHISVEKGELKAHYSLCRSRWCPVCAAKKRKEQRQMINGILTVRTDERAKTKSTLKHKKLFGLLTLTIPARKERSCADSLAYLDRCWKRTTKTREYKRLVDDGFAGCWSREVEYNAASGWYHFHQHALVEIPPNWSLQDLRDEIRSVWMKCGGGKIINLKGVDNEFGAIMETTKYITKDLTKSDDQLIEIINAVKGRRMFSVFGKLWKEARKQNEAKLSETEAGLTLPEEPSRINPKTGEIAQLNDGEYSIIELAERAKRNDWSAIWALRWFRWKQADNARQEAIRVQTSALAWRLINDFLDQAGVASRDSTSQSGIGGVA